MTPNGFAYLVLALWPLASFAMFRVLPPGRAIIGSLLVGYLFLPPGPTGFDLPLIPEMNKETLPSLMAFGLCFIFYGRRMRFLPVSMPARLLLLLFVFSPMLTALTNGEPVVFGTFVIQPLGIKEGLSMVIYNAIVVIPFVLAMNFLSTEADQRDILLALVIAGLAYSLPMLFEVRMSPQLNTWIYGFFQHSFDQMMRGGGFRPIVFLYHGLWVAFFCFTAVMAAFTLYRVEKHGRERRNASRYFWAGIYLFVVLVLCKSLGSLLYALVLGPIVLLAGTRMQLRVAMVLMAIAIFYPVLKGNDLVPEQALVQQAYEINPDRAGSLQFRLDNEYLLLERGAQKPLLGWGSFGRPFIHNSDGQMLTIPDGRWVITLGAFGWVGFIAEFGLLAFPLLLLVRKVRSVPAAHLPPWLGGAALILAANMIDMLPNATLTPLTWMMAGAMLGYAQTVRVAVRRTRLQSVM